MLFAIVTTGGLAMAGCSSTNTSNSPSATPPSSSSSSAASQSPGPPGTSPATRPACTQKALQAAFGNVEIAKFTCDGSDGAYYGAIRYKNEDGVNGVGFVKAEGTKWGAPVSENLCGSQTAENWPADLQAYCK